MVTTRRLPIEVVDMHEGGNVSDKSRKRKRRKGPDDLEEKLEEAEAKRAE
jgi:hypothetical protein